MNHTTKNPSRTTVIVLFMIMFGVVLVGCSKNISGPIADTATDVVEKPTILAAVETEGEKRGFIDKQGDWVIAPTFAQAGSFSNGYAAVSDVGESATDTLVLGGNYYRIDRDGNTLYEDVGSSEMFNFYGNHSFVADRDDGTYALALINRDGTIASGTYDSVIQGFAGPDYVTQGDTAGYIDALGNWIVTGDRDQVGGFYEGYALTLKDGLVRHIDETGSYIYSGSWTTADQFNEGLAGIESNDLRGFINTSGEVVITEQFDDVGQFNEGFAPVKIGDKWGFIDREGSVVVAPTYTAVRGFHEGKAAVQDGSMVGYIDTTGVVIIAPQFTASYDFHFDRAIAVSGSLLGFIDPTGTFVIEPQFTTANRFVASDQINQMERR